jgi:hypothetical protein
MFKFPVIELVDRWCIAKLKYSKLGNNKEELDFYTDQLHDIDFELIQKELDRLYEVHAQVWEVKDDFKKKRVDDQFDLAEIGRRALYVRDIMEERYVLKNIIADKLNDPVKERKSYGNGNFTI